MIEYCLVPQVRPSKLTPLIHINVHELFRKFSKPDLSRLTGWDDCAKLNVSILHHITSDGTRSGIPVPASAYCHSVGSRLNVSDSRSPGNRYMSPDRTDIHH